MSLCILTNTTALFPPTSSSSGQFIRAMTLSVNEQGLSLPGIEDFQRTYTELEREFRTILVLAPSGAILPIAETAQLAAHCHGGTANIVVVDTLQIGPGLGILTQLAARKAALGACLTEVEDYVRAVSPYLFTIICPGGTPHYQNQHVLCANNEQFLEGHHHRFPCDGTAHHTKCELTRTSQVHAASHQAALNLQQTTEYDWTLSNHMCR